MTLDGDTMRSLGYGDIFDRWGRYAAYGYCATRRIRSTLTPLPMSNAERLRRWREANRERARELARAASRAYRSRRAV